MTKTPQQQGHNVVTTTPSLNNQHPFKNKRSINQKPKSASGVQNRTSVYSEPTLKHITIEDLRDPARLDKLYQQTTAAGSLPHSEHARLNYFAGAVHALDAAKTNPCGLFASLYRQKLWSYITQAQEDKARATLKMLDYGEESHLPGQMKNKLPIYDSLAA